jgi:hypothetical protein
MDNSVIEQSGILCLKNFLYGSNIDPGKIDENDKTVSWDGFLYVYKDSASRKKLDLKYRISVQVKSHKVFERGELSNQFIVYNQLSKDHLQNYLEDGGIVLIRPVFIDNLNYSIYVKELLPVDITKLLEDPRKTPPITLRKKDNHFDFASFCEFYQYNKYLGTKNLVDIGFSEHDLPDEFSVHVDNSEVNYLNPKKRSLDSAKFYFESDHGIKIPIKDAKWIEGFKIDHQIVLSKIPFYNDYFLNKDGDNHEIHIGEKVLIIKPHENNIVFNYSWESDRRNFKDKIRDLMFLGLFAMGNNIELKDVTIQYNLFSIDERIKIVINSFSNVRLLLIEFEAEFKSSHIKYQENILKFLKTAKLFVDAHYKP